jgi:hypothetical protein
MALAVVTVAAGAIAGAAAMQHHSATTHGAFAKAEPDSIDQPGNLGPATYQDQQLGALAYPANTLPASLFNQERSYYDSKIKGRAKAKKGGWSLVGPTSSTQPAVLNFFNQYYGNNFNSGNLQVAGRVTAMALGPCGLAECKLWIAAAGGGVWLDDNALDSHSPWKYVSDGFGTNAIGTLTYDAKSHTLYAGTGEPNASSDSESGVGIYASKNNGNTWSYLPGSSVFNARSISSIVVDSKHPGTLYVGDTRGVRGVSGVTGGSVSLAPDAAPWGLYKSTNGGQTFTQVYNTPYPLRGVNHVELDSHGTLYAAAFGQGIVRSSDGGSTWEQVFATQEPTSTSARTEFSLNTTPDGHTRIYVGDGTSSAALTAVYRADSIDTTPASALATGGTDGGYTKLTSDGSTAAGRRDPHYATYNYCTTQCWYDNYVYSPPGYPNDVYVGGSFDYNRYPFYGGRAVLLSQDGGGTWTDQTTSANGAVGMHPDQHALVTNPANPLQFFEGSDGGVISSSGQVVDDSASFCAWGSTTTSSVNAACRNLHAAVPTALTTLNNGLSTLQFQNVVFNPHSPSTLIGGTQDNGTWLGTTGSGSWNQTIYGDGGIAAFDATNPSFAMNEFYGAGSDVNFRNGDPTAWVIVSGPLAQSHEATAFYKPQIGDPVVGGTFFQGGQSVWRTQDYGGNQAFLEANCQEFTVSFDNPSCGDLAPLGSPSDLTGPGYGASGQGGYVVSLTRATSDTGTLWAATATGRVFISKNADAPAGSVAFTRLDSLSAAAPGRFVTAIVVDPANPNHAWITYSGYNANTPSTPGHVFDVVYDPNTSTATWTSLDGGTGPLGDLPVTGLARDNSTGTLYAATDFGVLAYKGGSWVPAAAGMPEVETTWVTINQSTHTLYAATHGRGIWSLSLG